MENIIPSVILPLVVGSLPAVLTYLLGRRQARNTETTIKANAAATLTRAAAELVEDLRAEIERLQGKVLALDERVEKLERENKTLKEQNEKLAEMVSEKLIMQG